MRIVKSTMPEVVEDLHDRIMKASPEDRPHLRLQKHMLNALDVWREHEEAAGTEPHALANVVIGCTGSFLVNGLIFALGPAAALTVLGDMREAVFRAIVAVIDKAGGDLVDLTKAEQP
jgi:hypothetical protein